MKNITKVTGRGEVLLLALACHVVGFPLIAYVVIPDP